MKFQGMTMKSVINSLIVLFLTPMQIFAGPGITIEIDVFIHNPADPGPHYPTTDPVMADQDNDRHDSDCAGGQRESCEGQRE